MMGHNDNTPLPAPPVKEKRFGARCRAFKKVQLILPYQDTVYDGMLRNLSRTGARVDLPSALHVPATFRLHLLTDNIKRDCLVVWRKPHSLGVVFL